MYMYDTVESVEEDMQAGVHYIMIDGLLLVSYQQKFIYLYEGSVVFLVKLFHGICLVKQYKYILHRTLYFNMQHKISLTTDNYSCFFLYYETFFTSVLKGICST